MSPKQAARWIAALAITAVLAAGCGETPPTEAAPELARQLAQVDRAVTTGDDAQIRKRVESLESATESARGEGRLTDEQADRILAAAEALLAKLPPEEPEPAPSPSPTTSSPTPAPEEDEGDEGEGEGEGGEKSKHEPKPEHEPGKKGKGHDEDD